ncbi:chemotaxis-specific protein-glutamate methyltransferase CheB [Sphingomonas sp.]|uniref:chemotaxis-specific protein-glutamate methyltransferase CheB n=1 Tax=Sphingomonas sp. TaxID=28214 RepID=UPI0025DD1C78|nr:chemotaxis-specific protein-glutamate methyltransferase CheB [Sphingomonas sp.]
MSRPIRLMIVDDSMVARAVLSRMIEADGEFEIAAVAGSAESAIEALAHVVVDIVLLDLEMPGAGGLKSIPRIIEAARGAQIMIVSSFAEEGAEETVAALALGAADTLPKPGTGRFNGRFSEILVARLRALGRADRPSRETAALIARSQASGPALRAMASEPIELLALGASTGGIHALGNFFAALPPRIRVPILVTQHLPAAFMTVFARQLGVAANRPAVVAEDGMALVPDTLFIAPGDAHLTIAAGFDGLVVKLVRHAVSSGCLPSVDPMLASVGALLGRKGLGVVLTGMGRDGVEGAAKLVACGGAVLAQDEASSAVWGMPRAIADAGLAAAILPPDKLARRVSSRCSEK